MNYQYLWSDMHSNIHHNQMNQLMDWYRHAKKIMDFWPIAYYPFGIRFTETGAELEDLQPPAALEKDWQQILELAKYAREEGWPLFPGYEWQGNGSDGDHNVFFPETEGPMVHPMLYRELRDQLKELDAIAIPHHVAYQPGSRGKNWQTHDTEFSPFAEIYSSHGCSENDENHLVMERHEHMGPRTDVSCYEAGLDAGITVGCIASGDNHSIPGEADHGMMCVLSLSRDPKDIWQSLKARRVYGVSHSRMEIDFRMDDDCMGSIVTPGSKTLTVDVKAANAIDRIELLKDNILETMFVHSGTWERQPISGQFRFKFELEFGWGPETKFFPDAAKKEWDVKLQTPGKLLDIEPLWNSFGQDILSHDDHSCHFRLTSHRATETGKWMGPSNIRREAMIFEIEGTPENVLTLHVDGKEYLLAVSDLLKGTRIYAQYEECQRRIEEKFGPTPHYRDDFIWHCSFKFRAKKAAPEIAYRFHREQAMELEAGSQYRLRVWLKNGDTAWTSPIFCK